jgi:hypothetical protein
VKRDLASAAEAVGRLGISAAAGQAPVQIGWAILAFLVIAIIWDVAVPVLQVLGRCWAARLEARLMPPSQDEEN